MPTYDNAQWLIDRYNQAKTLRAPYEGEWRRSAAYCLPTQFHLWTTAGTAPVQPNNPANVVHFAHDSTARKAVPKFATICHRLATPKSQIWHKLTANNRELMRVRSVQLYFGELNRTLWQARYEAKARFSAAQTLHYTSQGVYGTGVKFIAQRRKTPLSPRSGLHYRNVNLRDVYVLLDEEGNVDTVFRDIWLTARQAEQKFKKERLPQRVRAELSKPNPSETEKFHFIHCVLPREDYDVGRMDAKRYPLASVYVGVDEKVIMDEPSGYSSWPYIVSRHFPDETYGVSPAQFAREAIGSANAMKRTLLKQGQKAVDPVLIGFDDGIVNGRVDMRPGAYNPGGVDSQGRKLIQTLDVGRVDIGAELLQAEQRDIEDAFFVKLFQILVDTPEMTATEVMERVAEKAALLAPTMEQMQSEDLAPMIEREIDVLDALNRLPEMPPEMIEAAGEYEVQYTSPLAKAQRAEEVAGFSRIVQMATEAAQVLQNAKPLRRINFDKAIPDIADVLSVPPEWLHSDEEVEALAQDDQQSQQIDQMAKAAPAVAGVMKAAGQMSQPTKTGAP